MVKIDIKPNSVRRRDVKPLVLFNIVGSNKIYLAIEYNEILYNTTNYAYWCIDINTGELTFNYPDVMVNIIGELTKE